MWWNHIVLVWFSYYQRQFLVLIVYYIYICVCLAYIMYMYTGWLLSLTGKQPYLYIATFDYNQFICLNQYSNVDQWTRSSILNKYMIIETCIQNSFNDSLYVYECTCLLLLLN